MKLVLRYSLSASFTTYSTFPSPLVSTSAGLVGLLCVTGGPSYHAFVSLWLLDLLIIVKLVMKVQRQPSKSPCLHPLAVLYLLMMSRVDYLCRYGYCSLSDDLLACGAQSDQELVIALSLLGLSLISWWKDPPSKNQDLQSIKLQK